MMSTASLAPNVPEPLFVGTAGWAVPKEMREEFTSEGSLLERYASVFSGVEINSSFHRPHRRTTYERWASVTPDAFRFSVKMSKEITHALKLRDAEAPLFRFLDEASGLGAKLGVILMQLPPSAAFDETVAADFFSLLRHTYGGVVALEPRHPSWFGDKAADIMRRSAIERVAADPPACAGAPRWDETKSRYIRLHGAPRIYYSDYPNGVLLKLAAHLSAVEVAGPAWCIFDNTASGRATANALTLFKVLENRVG